MHALDNPERLVDQGRADAYAAWYYDTLDPMTHLDHYRRPVAISFQSGAADRHVPAEDAISFRAALAQRYPDEAEHIKVVDHPDAGHTDVDDRFYDNALEWFTRS